MYRELDMVLKNVLEFETEWFKIWKNWVQTSVGRIS